MKKGMLSLITIIGLVIYAVGSIAYSFFDVTFDNMNTFMNISTEFLGEYVPVFTSSSDENIVLNVTTADMMVTNAGDVAQTARSTVNIYLEGVPANQGDGVSCEFDFKLIKNTESPYDEYVASPGVESENLKEFTIKIIDDEDNVIMPEKQISTINGGDNLVTGVTITADDQTQEKDYFVIATIYNLDRTQDITNKKYSFTIKTTNVDCTVVK